MGGKGVFVVDNADGVAGGISIAVGGGEMAGVGEVHALTRLKSINRMNVFAIDLCISFFLV